MTGRLNLRARLGVVLLLSLLPAAVLIALNAHREIEQTENNATRVVSGLLDSAELALSYAVEDSRRLIEAVAHIRSEHSRDSSECSDLFADLIPATPHLTNLLVADREGLVTCSAVPSPTPVSLADRDYVQKALAERTFVAGNFIIGRLSHRPVLPLALPLQDDKGTLAGLLIAALDAEWLSNRVLRQRSELPVASMLLDGNLTVIASDTQAHLIGQNIAASPIAALVRENSKALQVTTGLEGEQVLAGAKRLQLSAENTAYLVISHPLEERTQHIADEVLTSLLALLVVLGSAALLAWPLAYRLLFAQIENLTRQAGQLSKGRLATRADPALLSGDLRPIAESLDSMAQSLQEKERQEAVARQEILRRQAQLQGYLDNSTAIALMVDPGGHLLLANRHACDLLLGGCERLSDHPYYQRLPAPLAKVARQRDEAVLRSRSPQRADESFSLADDAPVYLSIRFPLLDEQGEPYAIGLIATDITDHRRLEQELQRACQELERSNRDLQDFAYISSHDLQEPLRKIESFGDRLLKHSAGQLDAKGQDYLQRVQNAAQRMRSLINSLLSYSRLSTRPQPFQPVEMNALVSDVLKDLEASIEKHQAVIEVSELPGLEADPLQMRQLLQNLIGNAIKFHRPGFPPRVAIGTRTTNPPRSERGRPLLELVIQDNGIGFEEKYIDKIFAPFQRLHGRNEYEGTGMGLAIVQKVVERHSGRIEVHSQPNQGTTFIITLPYTAEHRSTHEPSHEPRQQSACYSDGRR